MLLSRIHGKIKNFLAVSCPGPRIVVNRWPNALTKASQTGKLMMLERVNERELSQ